MSDRDLQVTKAQHQEMRTRLEQLQAHVCELQHDISAAEQAEVAAARHRDEAERFHAAAQRTLERAEAELRDLGD
jgi:chromosome segregation ATPase